jgi:hypothetical protein
VDVLRNPTSRQCRAESGGPTPGHTPRTGGALRTGDPSQHHPTAPSGACWTVVKVLITEGRGFKSRPRHHRSSRSQAPSVEFGAFLLLPVLQVVGDKPVTSTLQVLTRVRNGTRFRAAVRTDVNRRVLSNSKPDPATRSTTVRDTGTLPETTVPRPAPPLWCRTEGGIGGRSSGER